jgi:hypothetical protein
LGEGIERQEIIIVDSDWINPARRTSHPLFEIASVLMRLDHVACCIVNANHSIM